MFGNSHFESKWNNGCEYVKISKGRPDTNALVFLHGLFGGLSNYDGLISHIEDYDIFVPSLPIYDIDADQLTISHLSGWLHDFISSLDLDRPVILGNSLGGHVALDYTQKYPDKVLALVLTGSSGLQEKDFGSACPRRNDREYIRKQAAQTFYGDLIDEALLDEIMDVITDPGRLKNILALARDTHEYNMEQYLGNVAHPTLLIWGKDDQITPPEVGRKFYELMPNAQLRWIEKCGHAPMMEHPQTFALFLNEFLIELENNKDKLSTDYEENYSHL